MRGSIGRSVKPLTVSIDVAGHVLRDDGWGSLHGEGAGTINYDTGDWEFKFRHKPKEAYNGYSVSYDLPPVEPGAFIPVQDRRLIDVAGMAIDVVMRMLSNHPCPACGGKTYLQDGDEFGCVQVCCMQHGMFSLQRG